MPKTRERKHEPSNCPKCGTVGLDTTHESKYGTGQPQPGDITICYYCLTPLAFGRNMVLRLVTPEELEYCKKDNWLEKMKSAIRISKVKRKLIEPGT